MDKIKNLFLRDSYQDLKKNYEEILLKKKTTWDIVVITASNKMQADTYKTELQKRKKEGLIPSQTDFYVIPDLRGNRIGSGGSTLYVLAKLQKKYDLSKKKILIVHSGGDSKRIPQYSCFGKLFAPIPREFVPDSSSTLFDEIMIQMADIPNRMDEGIFVMCGDGLVLFNPLQIDLQYKKAVAISIKVPKEMGCNHGVFVSDSENTITEFLHKKPLSILEQKAVRNNTVDLDTGMVYLHSEIVIKLLSLIQTQKTFSQFISSKVSLNFYGDFLYPLAKNATLKDYLQEQGEKEKSVQLEECRKKIWEVLSGYALQIVKLVPALYLHFGTTEEVLNIMTQDLEEYYYLDWKSEVSSYMSQNYPITTINSWIQDTSFAKNIYIENSIVENATIHSNTILSNTTIRGKELPNNVVLSTVLLKGGQYVTRIYDISCNPKEPLAINTVFKNATNKKFFQSFSETSIWDASLYPVKSTLEESVEAALSLYRIVHNMATSEEEKSYYDSTRISMCDSFNQANTKEMSMQLENLKENILLKKITTVLEKMGPLQPVYDILVSSSKQKKILQKLTDALKDNNHSFNMRVYYLLSMLDPKKQEEYLEKVFQEVKQSVAKPHEKASPKFEKDFIELKSPVRINLGGAWNDAPPYCIERGSCVLNAAVLLNHCYPISVCIKKLKERKIVFECIDYNDKTEMKTLGEILDCSNPNDSYALLKCACVISGLVSEKETLQDIFTKIGGGIQITTNTEMIPRGSGLGTSSILAGTVLKALYQFMGYEIDDSTIFHEVLCLEQLMSTGGGWQDQVGGLVKGLKITRTQPGSYQKFQIQKISLPKKIKEELNERLLLINTAQRRLARNILREVVKKYIKGDQEFLQLLADVQVIAQDMVNALENGDFKQFGKLLDEHLEYIKKLDQNSTNTCIDFIFESISDLIDGKSVLGAGGGGFLIVLLKKGVTKEKFDQSIMEVFQDTGVMSFQVEVEEEV